MGTRGGELEGSDLDVAVIADITGDHDALLEALDGGRLTPGESPDDIPSLLIADRPSAGSGQSVDVGPSRDAIVLVERGLVSDGS